MPITAETVSVRIDGRVVRVPAGTTVAVAVLNAGIGGFRTSVGGEARGPLCGMGTCFECRLTVDGRSHSRSCRIECGDGMEIHTT
jgi:predicted molibdopterin-dependent oxidoreductase YjgC